MVEPDPTWGFSMMPGDYGPAARDNVDLVMENLLHVQQDVLGDNADTRDVCANKLYRRLMFDLVEDQEALERASHDRVRECFFAYLRGLGPLRDNKKYFIQEQYRACLVLDTGKIEMLVNIHFHDESVIETCKLRLLRSLGNVQ